MTTTRAARLLAAALFVVAAAAAILLLRTDAPRRPAESACRALSRAGDGPRAR